MHLSIVTPTGEKLDAEVTQVTAPGELGDLGILPGHLPLLTGLGVGVLSYTKAGAPAQVLAIAGGYLEVAEDRIIVATQTAEAPEEIDLTRARRALERATKQLAAVDPSASGDVQRLGAALRRAQNRIEVGGTAKLKLPPQG